MVKSKADPKLGAFQIFILLTISLGGCGDASTGNVICYSKFTFLEQSTFRSPDPHPLTNLQDQLIEIYTKGESILDVPIASGLDVYLVSKCDYVAVVRRKLDPSIQFMKISKKDYDDIRNIAGQSGRVMDAR